MNLLRHYEPWGLLDQLRRDYIEQMLAHSGTPTSGDSTVATSAWVPAIDLKEEVNQFIIEADIPGVDPKDIEISMANGVLTIKGERKSESQEEGKNYHRVERIHGSFYRRFSLPDTADADKIVASGKNGVLQVRIPKKEVAQPRKIAIQT
jgi:HSP20 family protein